MSDMNALPARKGQGTAGVAREAMPVRDGNWEKDPFDNRTTPSDVKFGNHPEGTSGKNDTLANNIEKPNGNAYATR